MALPPRLARLVGSKFTSQTVRSGWTHFHVVSLKRTSDGYEAELAASCDGARRISVGTKELFDRAQWTPGWETLTAQR